MIYMEILARFPDDNEEEAQDVSILERWKFANTNDAISFIRENFIQGNVPMFIMSLYPEARVEYTLYGGKNERVSM